MGLVLSSPFSVSSSLRVEGRWLEQRIAYRGRPDSLHWLLISFLQKIRLPYVGLFFSYPFLHYFFLQAGVWADHPLLGPGLRTAMSRHPGHLSEKPYLSKSLLLKYIDLLPPALELLGVSIPAPAYGIPPSSISICWASSPASNLHSFGVPFMDLII